MFSGEFINSLDSKGRASIPAAFRAALKEVGERDSLVVTKNSGGLVAFPTQDWDRIRARVLELPPGPRRTNNLRTRIAPAEERPFDPQGRIQIPKSLREYAGLSNGDPCVIVGLEDRIEIWSKAAHVEATSVSEAALDEDPQGQADLGL